MKTSDPILAHIITGLLQTADDLEQFFGMCTAAERFRQEAANEQKWLRVIETGIMELEGRR